MGKHHLALVSEAKTAIDRVFADTTVDSATTRESLQELVEDLESKIETIED